MKIKFNLTQIFCTFSLLALIINQQLDTKTENQVQAIPRDFIIAQTPTSTPQASCQATVNKVLQEIRAKGVKTVNFRVLKNSANQGVSSKRNDELEIILSESDSGNIILSETRTGNSQINAKITEILSSDTLLDSWSDEIFKSCDKTGTVYFYGLMTNEILRLVRTYK